MCVLQLWLPYYCLPNSNIPQPISGEHFRISPKHSYHRVKQAQLILIQLNLLFALNKLNKLILLENLKHYRAVILFLVVISLKPFLALHVHMTHCRQ